jgi:hypothetical protein
MWLSTVGPRCHEVCWGVGREHSGVTESNWVQLSTTEYMWILLYDQEHPNMARYTPSLFVVCLSKFWCIWHLAPCGIGYILALLRTFGLWRDWVHLDPYVTEYNWPLVSLIIFFIPGVAEYIYNLVQLITFGPWVSD